MVACQIPTQSVLHHTTHTSSDQAKTQGSLTHY